MICSPPNNMDVERIRFFKNLTEIQSDTKKETMYYYIMITSMKENEGFYVCGYWLRSNGEVKQSYRSNEVNIQIADVIDDRDTPASWIYYIVGGLVILAVSLLSCLVYKRMEKRKTPSSAAGTRITHHNLGHGVFREPVNNIPLLVQSQMNNTMCSIIYQNTTPANEQAEAETRRMTDSKEQAEEEDHMYLEIETERNNYQNQTTESEYTSLNVSNVSIYYTAHVPFPLPSAYKSSLIKQPKY
ncbi:uncharacterized protein [Eleutherodactylus coqui]